MWGGRVGASEKESDDAVFFGPTDPSPTPTPLLPSSPGDGSTDHLDGAPASIPPAFPLPPPGAAADVGREPPADVVLPLPTVSARHARIVVADDGAVSLADCGSTNGTYVDGEPLAAGGGAVAVPVGAAVVFGDQYLAAFRLEDVADE